MIIELRTERPDIYVGGVGLFHHLWLHVILAYYKCMQKMFDQMN